MRDEFGCLLRALKLAKTLSNYRLINQNLMNPSKIEVNERNFEREIETMSIQPLPTVIISPLLSESQRDVLKFLKRIRPDMQRVTDEQGMEWFEIRLSEQDAKAPVQAF